MALHQLFTVRNAQGQFLATYRAKDEKAAIDRFLEDQAATASTFRKSQPMQRFTGLTAKVEGS